MVELNKRKRVFYNLVIGIFGKILLMVLGFLVPKLYIENYGSEINGLLSSITQVFAYLSLLEAGVGTAATQALYEPITQDDKGKINGILSAASRFYKRTGILYALGVLIFAIVYPLVVKNSVGASTVFLLIVLSGANGVLNYFFQAKYFSLLNAEGKGYVYVAINTVISVITTVSKIVLLAFKANILIVYTAYFLLALLQNVVMTIYIKRNYRYLNFGVKPDNEALKQSNSVLIHQISALIFSHTDVLLLTAFYNLQTVSVYTIYNMVTENIGVILSIVFGSFTAALGLIFQENKDRFRKVYDLFEMGVWILSFGVMVVTLVLFTPFISLYTAKSDIVYTDQWLPLLFVLCKTLSLIRTPGVYAINIAGHFKLTQSRTILESGINIVVSLIGVRFFGMYGVLLGTLVALLYRTTDYILYVNRHIVYRKLAHIVKRLSINIFTGIVLVLASSRLIPTIKTVPEFILIGVVLTVVTFSLYILVNCLNERKKESLSLFWQLISERIKRMHS